MKTHQSGFSLLEALVSIAIISLMSIQLITVFTASGYWIAQARNQTTASYLAYAVIETIGMEHYEFPADMVFDQILLPLEAGIDIDIPDGFAAQLSITAIADYSNLYRIKVLVSWLEAGIEHSLCMYRILRKVTSANSAV
ncbi:MAG: type IV pilus modification PilV family protein [Syntrophomonadaceae bacterium]|jgi:prepilin-type N-terminal cleavage/methylation domain-containing protein